ncbi:MAG: hypothetical protein ACOYK6_06990 [Chthoniobacterales bacterium]
MSFIDPKQSGNFIEATLDNYGLNPLSSPKTSDAKFGTFFGIPVTLGKTINWSLRKIANSLSMRHSYNPNQAVADLLLDILQKGGMLKSLGSFTHETLKRGFYNTKNNTKEDTDRYNKHALTRAIGYVSENAEILSKFDLHELENFKKRLELLQNKYAKKIDVMTVDFSDYANNNSLDDTTGDDNAPKSDITTGYEQLKQILDFAISTKKQERQIQK